MIFLPYALILATATGIAQVKPDEEVLLFNTWAGQDADGRDWLVPIHGWVFEPESDSVTRELLIAALTEAVEEQRGMDREAERILDRRIRWFVVDSERGKRVPLRIADRLYTVGPSAINGHFRHMLRLDPGAVPKSDAGNKASYAWLEVAVVRGGKPPDPPAASVQLLRPTGLSVISDIDDTIKSTHVSDPEAMLVNTFLRPFEPVEGMPDLYRDWSRAGAAFHYVSDSPWQLYRELIAFMEEAGFPMGSFDLRSIRLHSVNLQKLLEEPAVTKAARIEALLKQCPRRRFILVGDSSQKDPEVYGDMARRYPDQVLVICIRNLSGESAEADRYKKAFHDVPRERWKLFDKPSELKDLEVLADNAANHIATQPATPIAR